MDPLVIAYGEGDQLAYEAGRLLEEVLGSFAAHLRAIEIEPSAGENFVVRLGETVVFDAAEEGHLPLPGEVEERLRAVLSRGSAGGGI